MNIIKTERLRNYLSFADIEPGELFGYDGKLYLKTKVGTPNVNAVLLTDGSPAFFLTDGGQVYRVSATLTYSEV